MDSTTEKYLVQPALTGASASALVAAMYGNSGSMEMPLLGSVSPAVGVFALGFVSDVVGTAVTDAISDVNQVQELDDLQKGLIKPAINAAAFAGSARAVAGPFASYSSAARVAGIGAASSVGGSYLAGMVPKE